MSGHSTDYQALIRAVGNSVEPTGRTRSRILVTGGAGYIGSHTAKALFQAGYEPVTFDNLSTGHRRAVKWGPFVEGDLANLALIRETLRKYEIQTVVHFAASALVGESMTNPGLYFRNNAANSGNLLEAMHAEGVTQIVFSSSCAVYGHPQTVPIPENARVQPVNPYGESKLAVETQLRWYSELCGTKSIVLRYFNAAGADPDGDLGEDHDPESHLIPSAIRACLAEVPCLNIYGDDYPTPDGTAVRDYIHVSDLAAAHVRAVEYLRAGGSSETLNLGTGRGYSVREVVAAVESVSGRAVPQRTMPRRAGDPPALVAQASRAKSVLGWEPAFRDLTEIVRTAWNWKTGKRPSARVSVTENRSPVRVAVIGAGPAGMTAAYELSKAGASVDVYEAGTDVGGLAKTVELWGQLVDIGPHRFFSTDARVNRLWLDVVGQDYRMVDRMTRILYNNRFFHYPLKAFDALTNLGVIEAARCTLSYGKQVVRPDVDSGSFEDWVVRAFGRRLFEIFFKTYSEKLWGITCRELDADFAAQRIKKLSFYEAVKAAFQNGGKTRHKTLVDRFAYPLEGTGMVYQRMANYVRSRGNNIFLRTPVERVGLIDGSVQGLYLAADRFVPYRYVISTMPLTLLVKTLPETPEHIRAKARSLRFRNTILIYLHVDRASLFPDNWLYIHSPELQVGRITNFRNWVPSINRGRESTILALEYWCNESDPMWSAGDKELIELATREMRSTTLIGDARITEGRVHRINRCYPVYSAGYKNFLKPVESYLSSIRGLQAIGRYGAFKYNNQDHSILMGLLAARNLIAGDSNDLWSINTDYENYQEGGVITETGLVTTSA